MKPFKTFPILQTERLRLRQVVETDIDRIDFLRSDAEINKYIKRAEPQTRELAKAHIELISQGFLNNKCIEWGITQKTAPLLLGSICLWNYSEDLKTAEVGYGMDTEFQGKGIMSEALQAVLRFGFEEFKFETIEAFTHAENKASRNLLEKAGFTLIVDKKDEGNPDNVIYAINKL